MMPTNAQVAEVLTSAVAEMRRDGALDVDAALRLVVYGQPDIRLPDEDTHESMLVCMGASAVEVAHEPEDGGRTLAADLPPDVAVVVAEAEARRLASL